MRQRGWTVIGCLTLIVIALVAPAIGQSGTASKKAPEVKSWRVPRTAWGHPDLQGIWNNGTTTPLERPNDLADREYLTDEEWAARAKEAATRAEKRPDDPVADVELAYNNEWYDRGVPLKRTSLIVDPPNGKLPPLTAEGQRRVAARDAARRAHGPADSSVDRPLQERCLLYHGVPPFPTGYNNNYLIVQTPDTVAIRYEMLAETRIIPLDRRPHPGPAVRSWIGNARGHWEADTLVVETTNYNDKATFRFPVANDTLRVVERFTRTSDDRIDYEFTVDNPAMYARPWTAVLPMAKAEGPILEYACHEGNYAIANVLSGYRSQETRSAAAQGRSPASETAAQASTGTALKDRFVGTWKLINVEQRNAKGELIDPTSAASSNRTGYLIYDPSGYMAVSIVPAGRKKYAGAQPTADEAKAAIAGYAAYFGSFTVNEGDSTVTHHLQGSLNPGMAPEQKRFFEFAGDRLTLKPPIAANGNQSRLTWQRMPDMPNLTAEQRRFSGFWRLVSNERRNENRELVVSNEGQTGYIIYTSAGFMMVHMIRPNRKPYTGSQPTPEEAEQALRTYANYFGPFYVHEADGYVVHDQIGTLNVGRNGPTPMQRFYRFSGNRLLLQPPPTYSADGHTLQGTITWERVSGGAGTR